MDGDPHVGVDQVTVLAARDETPGLHRGQRRRREARVRGLDDTLIAHPAGRVDDKVHGCVALDPGQTQARRVHGTNHLDRIRRVGGGGISLGLGDPIRKPLDIALFHGNG
jgi:hypothetical protein